jgi:hypothetical protein
LFKTKRLRQVESDFIENFGRFLHLSRRTNEIAGRGRLIRGEEINELKKLQEESFGLLNDAVMLYFKIETMISVAREAECNRKDDLKNRMRNKETL